MNDGRERSKTTRSKALIISVAIVMLIVGVVLLVGTKTGLFGAAVDDTGNEDKTGRDIDYSPHKPTEEYSYIIDPSDPFAAVIPLKNYSCIVIVSDSYNEKSTYAYNVTSVGEKFSCNDGRRTVIYNGEELYIKSSVYEVRQKTREASIASELGIVSFEELKERVYGGQGEINVSDDGKTIHISFFDEDLWESYKVDAVNGVITQYSMMRDGVQIKSFSVINLSPLPDEEINDNYFKIPD